jgi:hypothetical protein
MRTTVPDGVADSGLFRAYMQSLCPERLVLTPKDFLARGADGDGKGDFQGCSSFNPLLIFSKQREDQFEQAAQSQGQAGTAVRNQANAPNRRVMVLLFQIGSKVDFAKWPCPRATEGTAGCIRRFWSDGQNRRMKRLPDQDRMFEKTFDTFACRFYQRISDGSPCHRMAPTLRLRLFDRQAQPLPNAPYFVTMSDRTASGFTDKNGFAFLRDVELPATCEARWSRASALLDSSSKPPDANWQDFEFHHSVFVDLEESNPVSTPPSPVADSRRLSNMGYIFKDTMTENVQAFQRDAALDLSGALADASPKIRAQHDVVIAPPQPSRPEAESSGGDGGSEDG